MFRHLEKSSSNHQQDEDDDVFAIVQQITYCCDTVSPSESLNNKFIDGHDDNPKGRTIYTRTDLEDTPTQTEQNAFHMRYNKDEIDTRHNKDENQSHVDRGATHTRSDSDDTSTLTDKNAVNTSNNKDEVYTRGNQDTTQSNETHTRADLDDSPKLTDQANMHTHQDASYTCLNSELGTEPESDSDDDSMGDVIEEIKQKYGDKLQEMLSAYEQKNSKEIDQDDIENHIDNIPTETQTEEPNTSCATCCKNRRVEHVSWLEKGQHIRLLGKHFTYRFGKTNISVYHHHAIIKEVQITAKNSVKLVLIHFEKKNEKISIRQTEETYDLKKDDIEIVEYERPRYDPDTIVQRAESMLQKEEDASETKEFDSYSFINRNCEHFASWCVVGEGESLQAKDFKESSFKVLNKAAGIGCKISRFVTKSISQASKLPVATGLKLSNLLPGVLLGASAFFQLIYTIAMTISHRIKYSRGKMCKVCFKREVISLWTSFGTFCVTLGVSYILVNFLLPLLGTGPAGIPLLLVIVCMSLLTQWGLGKIVKALKSPYTYNKIEVNKLSQISPGSMISFKYFGIHHVAIVTETDDESEDSLTGNITFVHYGLRGNNLLGTRVVKKDALRLNVKDNVKDVKLVETYCSSLKKFRPDVVVARVKARIGETKWSPFSNRSDHLCFDCLVHEKCGQEDQTTEEESECQTGPERKSTICLGRKEIHLRSDLEAGHIVRYFGHSGIVVDLEDCSEKNQQRFRMELIVYKDRCGTRRKFSVDLKNKRLYIEKYHPAHCFPMTERVRRAREKENEYCSVSENDFLESCILKDD